MIKLVTQKESICFNFENDEQKNFFDKAKKCDIIRNNNSVFLKKILSVKNQSLLDKTLNQSKSQYFKPINTSPNDQKQLNINNSSSNLTIDHKKREDLNFNILSPQINLDEINLNNSFKIEISPRQMLSPKIIVNKNKNLRLNNKSKEKEKEDTKDPLLYLNHILISERDNINNDKIQRELNQKIRERYQLNTINKAYNINPEINFSNLYTKNYIRKPVVIKFKKDFNCKNIKNQNINKNGLIQEENKENIPNNNQELNTETYMKPYNFSKKNNLETELYRSFEDLEKKSLEITKRKKHKNLENYISSFKKENNLEKLKESLDNYRQKIKFNLQKKRKKKKNFININSSNNGSIKNNEIKINNNNNLNINTNIEKISKIEEYNCQIKKQEENNNQNKNIHWHRQNSHNFNNINISDFNDFDNSVKKINKNNIGHLPKIKSEELLINNNINKNRKNKSIKINFIEDSKTENIYNVSLNTNNVNEAFKRFHISLDNDHNYNYKNYIIRQKYGKKHNKYENNKIQSRDKKKKKEISKSPSITKIFIEDNKTNDDNITGMSHCLSESILPQNKDEIQIKVNKKIINGKRSTKIDNAHKNANSFLDLEEKINKEINTHLNIINGIEILNGFMNSQRKKNIKENFILLFNYFYQSGIYNNTTILTNASQISDIKYVKKIVKRQSFSKKRENNPKNKIKKNKSFNAQKQKILILKRKDFGFFEKYEHCLDFIKNFRLFLLKYSSRNKNNNL